MPGTWQCWPQTWCTELTFSLNPQTINDQPLILHHPFTFQPKKHLCPISNSGSAKCQKMDSSPPALQRQTFEASVCIWPRAVVQWCNKLPNIRIPFYFSQLVASLMGSFGGPIMAPLFFSSQKIPQALFAPTACYTNARLSFRAFYQQYVIKGVKMKKQDEAYQRTR